MPPGVDAPPHEKHVRKELKETPYDLFTKEYGEDIASLFNISRINPNDVTLKLSLLGIEVKVKEWVLQDRRPATPDKRP